MVEFIKIPEIESGTRLLRWFLRHYPGMLQKDFYKLCRGGQIRVNSSRCKGMEILTTGDMVRIPPTLSSYKNSNIKKTNTGDVFSLADLEKLRKCIIHNDKDIVVFNKPAGLAVQGGSGIKKSIDKMVMALFPYDKVSLVHRLDKETSGILVVAKNQKSAQNLSRQFQNKTAKKEYLALLDGKISVKHGVIDNYMSKGFVTDNKNIQDNQNLQRAVTEYKVLGEVHGMYSWVHFLPKTGRTHQLRLHSAFSLKAPIVGDFLYGKKHTDTFLNTNKLFLLAYKISFRHPGNGKEISFNASVPDFMQPVLKTLELHLP